MLALYPFPSSPIAWLALDACTMTFPANSVDIAINEGAFDARLYGSFFDLTDEAKANVMAYVDQVARVFKPDGGKWLYVTSQ
jgi:hypothetical protein